MSTTQQSAVILIWWAFWVCAFVLVAFLLSILARGVELSIVGHSTGHGMQLLNFTGDTLNVSLLQNGTGWYVSAVNGT